MSIRVLIVDHHEHIRKLGFIHYNGGGMQIHSSLLNVVLHD
jgi:hypothetical protein